MSPEEIRKDLEKLKRLELKKITKRFSDSYSNILKTSSYSR